MTKSILISVICGIAAGYLFLPDIFIQWSEELLVIGLSTVLFFVGMDIGIEGTIVTNFKKIGFRIIAFPLAIIVGTLAGAMLGSLFLPITMKDAALVGAGLGWYTLAPILLADYSTEVSAVSFMHNVMREMIGIVLIPIVAKKIGFLETVALPGAASMDVCLPIIERTTRSDIVVYSFISGVVLSIAVPTLIPLIMRL